MIVGRRLLGLALVVVGVDQPEEFDTAFAAITRDRAEALIEMGNPVTENQLEGERFRFHDYPVIQFFGVQSETPEFLIEQVDAWIKTSRPVANRASPAVR